MHYGFYSYNNEGNLMWEVNQFNAIGISSGNKGLPSLIMYPGYDLRGNLRGEIVDAGLDFNSEIEYTYTYDLWGRLECVSANANMVADYKYDDALGLVTETKYYGNNATCNNISVDTISYTYDIRDRLTQIKSHFLTEDLYYDNSHPQTADTSFKVAAHLNFNGNINATKATYKLNRATNNPGNFNGATVYGYSYDGLNRLTKADASVFDNLTGNPALPNPKRKYGDESYTYDKIGNLLTMTRSQYYNPGVSNPPNYTANWTYVYQSGNNRLANISENGSPVRTYTYDNNGNLRTDSYRSITQSVYGRANLPITLTANGDNLKYSYNINDIRIYKENTTDNIKEYYINNTFGKTLGVLNMVNNQWTWYIYGKERVAKTSGEFYVNDHLGNTRVNYTTTINCNTNAVTYSLIGVYDFYPYGKVLRSFLSGSREKFLSTQHERDLETDLDCKGARFYDGEIGLFFSIDPKAMEFKNWSSYNYTLDNPVKLTDPDGAGPFDPAIGLRANVNLGFGAGRLYLFAGATFSVSHRQGFAQSTLDLSASVYNGGLGTAGNSSSIQYDITAAGHATLGGGQGEGMPIYTLNYNTRSAVNNTFQNSGTYGQMLNYNSGTNDITRQGIIGGRVGNFSFTSNNDTKLGYGGGGTDQGWTGGITLSLKVGTNLIEGGYQSFTGTHFGENSQKKSGESLFYSQSSEQQSFNKASTFGRFNGATMDSFGQGWFQNGIHNSLNLKLFKYDYKSSESSKPVLSLD